MATQSLPTVKRHTFSYSRELEVIYGIWLRDFKKFWREKSRLWGGVARPILWLVILGSSLKPVVTDNTLTGNVDYIQYIFPGVIGLTLIFATMQSAISIIWDREFGFLKEVLAAPVSRISIIIGKVLGGATQATLQGIITLAFAPLIGLRLTPIAVLELIVIMFGVSFALTSLGVVIASRMTSFEGFGTISNFVVMPMYFLSGGIYPTSSAPEWMQPFIAINPLSYGVDALRHITIGQGTFAFGLDVAFLAGFTVVMSMVALWLFKRE
ncbi:MAG: ABC transporter permease [Chloroflexi bacterium]|nr:ABC transporter permease [Chloroflexota bacterium]MCC6892946.1 ABC transporter permease [Anaerolineae bacterium]